MMNAYSTFMILVSTRIEEQNRDIEECDTWK